MVYVLVLATITGLSQGRNEVCGIRDQRGGIKDQKGGIWDHSPGIRDHKPWDRDQQFFQGAGIRLYHFCGIRYQNLSRFWNQGSEILVQKWISDEKPYLVTTMLSVQQ